MVAGALDLGADADARDELPVAITEQFRQACQKVAAVHERFPELEDATAEFTLLRSCAGVCKITHLLRAVGPDISADALVKFEDAVSILSPPTFRPLFSMKSLCFG